MPFNKKLFDAAMQSVHHNELGITPAFDGGARVMVLRDDSVEKIGHIHVPDTHRKRERHGTIVAISEKGETTPYLSTVAVGKRASFNAYDGTIHTIPAIVDGEPTQIEVIVLHISAIYLTWRTLDLEISSRPATEDREV